MLNRVHPVRRVIAGFSLLGLVLSGNLGPSAHGAAYVSGVSISGTSVSFVLNESADILTYSINGGPATALDGSTKGTKSFTLSSPTDTFSVTATKLEADGYTIPSGVTLPENSSGLSQPTAGGMLRLISDDLTFVRFNNPRGVAVATNPNNPQFGTAYIANSQAGSTAAPNPRSVGDGLYALKADQTDAFGKGNTATPTGFETPASIAAPNRISVGGDHRIYIADWSDGSGGVYRMSGRLTEPARVLAGNAGPSTLPAGQNHGSTTSVLVQSSATGVTLYTIDEDLTSAQFTPGTSTTDRNSLWQYNIADTDVLPFAGPATKIAGPLLNQAGVSNDFDRGANGNFYLSQLRANGAEAGLFVLSADGSTVLFDSLVASRALLGVPTAADILTNIAGIAVSPDQKYLAAIVNSSDVLVLRLDAMGIPDLGSRLLINTAPDVTNARDIAFDAAGNIHYVSPGQQRYRVLAPGGYSSATTSWDGTSFSFVIVPEPGTALLLGAGMLSLARRKRRALEA
jgi:hypothetical protein